MNYRFIYCFTALFIISACAGNEDQENHNSNAGVIVKADSVAIRTKKGNGVYATDDSVGIHLGGHQIKVSADSIILK